MFNITFDYHTQNLNMKFLIRFLFILSVINLNAQIEQTEPVTESSVRTQCIQIVKGEVRDKNTTDLLAGAEVVLSDNVGNVLETQIVKEDATFSFQVSCTTTYKLEGKRADFTPESKIFTTSDESYKELKLLISLGKGDINFLINSNAEKIEEKVEEKVGEIVQEKLPDALPEETVTSTINEQINPIYFDYDSSYLSKEAKARLQKIVDLMKEHPKLIIQCAAHTDSKGPDKYNTWMANRRANRTVDYIIKKGINSNRISGKGFGATQLINHCSKVVECTEEQQAKNRRTEFVIIKG